MSVVRDTLFQCPYKIQGSVVIVYNPLYDRLKKKGTNVWDSVILQPGDQLVVDWTRQYDLPESHFSFGVSYPPVIWNGKTFHFYSSGPRPTENLRDLRPRCTICGNILDKSKLEEHEKCLLEGDDNNWD